MPYIQDGPENIIKDLNEMVQKYVNKYLDEARKQLVDPKADITKKIDNVLAAVRQGKEVKFFYRKKLPKAVRFFEMALEGVKEDDPANSHITHHFDYTGAPSLHRHPGSNLAGPLCKPG